MRGPAVHAPSQDTIHPAEVVTDQGKAAGLHTWLGKEQIDGALVGGASLVAADFIAICQAAVK